MRHAGIGFSAESDAHTDNLVTSVRQLKPYSVEPGETFISTVTGEVLNDYTTNTIRDGGDWFNTTSTNPDLEIKFAVQTNILEFLPGETYTITWEYGFMCSATAKLPDGSLSTTTGSGPLNVGFNRNTGSTAIDINSPRATYVNNSGELFSSNSKTETRRHTFTFRADDIATTTNNEFRIEGTVAAVIKGSQRLFDWKLFANALIKNLKVYRGDEEIANSQFIDIEYAVKEYSSILTTERENHAIGEPSPPDQWFVKFPAAGGPSTAPNIPPSVQITPGGGKGLNWPPPPPPPPPDPDPDDPIIPPPSGPDDTDGGETIIIDENTTEGSATKLSRLLVTNEINLQSNSIYRFHALINRIKNSDADKVLKIRIEPSLASLKPSFDGTIITSGIQFPIIWEFDTTGIAAADLLGIRFRIDMFEENIDVTDAAAVYVSDINILGKISELPINTIYRYDGEIWDNEITQVSDDGGIVGGQPNSLVESYEVNSAIQRLYCISSGNIYVWGIGALDPYGSTITSRIVSSW